MTNLPMILVGSYEEFLLGYDIINGDTDGKKFHLVFSTHAHNASIRCIDAHGQYLASSGADEYINIYDLKLMQESGVLSQHSGTVTGVKFTPDGSHLVSCSQDGSIAIFRCQDWQLVKYWKKAHEVANGVTSIKIHPSGTMLSSIGADNILKMWNIVKGRLAYARNYSKFCGPGIVLELVEWCNTGLYFAVALGKKAIVYLVSTAGVLYEFSLESRVTCLQFALNQLVCVGTEDGTIEIHSTKHNKQLYTEKLHDSRIKCMKFFHVSNDTNTKKKAKFYIVTADSKGTIKLWLMKKSLSTYSLHLICNVNTDCRITCLTLANLTNIKQETEEISDVAQTVQTKKKHSKGAHQTAEVDSRKLNKTGSQKKKKKKLSIETNHKDINVSKTNGKKSGGKLNTSGKWEVCKTKDVGKTQENKKRKSIGTWDVCDDVQQKKKQKKINKNSTL